MPQGKPPAVAIPRQGVNVISPPPVVFHSSGGGLAARTDRPHYLADTAETLFPATDAEAFPWQQGGLDSNTVITGVIYAEILQPPRALRKRIR